MNYKKGSVVLIIDKNTGSTIKQIKVKEDCCDKLLMRQIMFETDYKLTPDTLKIVK